MREVPRWTKPAQSSASFTWNIIMTLDTKCHNSSALAVLLRAQRSEARHLLGKCPSQLSHSWFTSKRFKISYALHRTIVWCHEFIEAKISNLEFRDSSRTNALKRMAPLLPVCPIIRHITVCTECRTVVRATRLVNGTPPPKFLDTQGSKNPWTDTYQTWYDYFGDLTPHANFGVSILKGWGCIYVKLSSSVSIFTPRYFFTSLRTCTGRTVWPIFVVYDPNDVITRNLRRFRGYEQNKYLIFLTTFLQKNTRNSLCPQCKNSIGNNSGSVKDRVMQFAYIRGVSTTDDQIMWPPSLSRDRKWSRPLIRRKIASWLRV